MKTILLFLAVLSSDPADVAETTQIKISNNKVTTLNYELKNGERSIRKLFCSVHHLSARILHIIRDEEIMI
jgi:hypothetical protein